MAVVVIERDGREVEYIIGQGFAAEEDLLLRVMDANREVIALYHPASWQSVTIATGTVSTDAGKGT